MVSVHDVAICMIIMMSRCHHFYIAASSKSFFGHGQCQAGTSGDIIDGVWVIWIE